MRVENSPRFPGCRARTVRNLVRDALERSDRLRVWDDASRPVVLPSLLACDFSRMAQELAALESAGVKSVHLDVMDGAFVPNLSYGAPVVKRWRECTNLTFDTHLMISNPKKYVKDFVDAGCDSLIVHIEAEPTPSELLREIRGFGCRACLALNPATPLAAIEPYLGEVDGVLVMSVSPGFGGQAFDASVLEKVRSIHKRHPNLVLGIDGGVNPRTAGAAASAGATHLIAGSAVFKSGGGYASALAELAAAASRGGQGG